MSTHILIVVSALSACTTSHEPSQHTPPPYFVRVCESTPDDERDRWIDKAAEWNRAVNTQPVFWVARTDAVGCGVYVCAGEENAVHFGECETSVSYVLGDEQEARLLGLVLGVRMAGGKVSEEDVREFWELWP